MRRRRRWWWCLLRHFRQSVHNITEFRLEIPLALLLLFVDCLVHATEPRRRGAHFFMNCRCTSRRSCPQSIHSLCYPPSSRGSRAPHDNIPKLPRETNTYTHTYTYTCQRLSLILSFSLSLSACVCAYSRWFLSIIVLPLLM